MRSLVYTWPLTYHLDVAAQWREIINNKKEIVVIKNLPDGMWAHSNIDDCNHENFRKYINIFTRLSNFFHNYPSFISILKKHSMFLSPSYDNQHYSLIAYTLYNSVNQLPFNAGELESILDPLKHFPFDLELDFSRRQIQTLSENLGEFFHLSKLNLSHNLLEEIPACLYRLPSTCVIRLHNNRLSPEIIEQCQAIMQAENYQGPQFILSVYDRANNTPSLYLETILKNWCNEICQQKIIKGFSLEQKNNLSNWLARLEDTADFKSQSQKVRDKVYPLLKWLGEASDPTNTAIAHQIIAEATATCGDRVSLSLNTLSIHVKICESHLLNLAELKDLIIGLDRYERLNKIAEQKCQELRMVDPIEVHLCYEIGLKEALKLPVETNQMLYKHLAGVKEEDIEKAKEQILAETTLSKQLSILLQHPIWKTSLEKNPEFEKIKESCAQQKQNALNQIETTDSDAAQHYYRQFQEKDLTIWNPYYCLTNQLLTN